MKDGIDAAKDRSGMREGHGREDAEEDMHEAAVRVRSGECGESAIAEPWYDSTTVDYDSGMTVADSTTVMHDSQQDSCTTVNTTVI